MEPYDESSLDEGLVPAHVDPFVEALQERILGAPLDLDRRAVAREVGVSFRTAERFWHALGFPPVTDGAHAFSRTDLKALEIIAELVRSGRLDESTALGLTRAFARTTDRLSVWQTSLLAEALSPWQQGDVELSRAHLAEGHDSTRAEPDESTARAAVSALAELADELEPLLVYAWRRHLTSAVARMVSDADPVAMGPGGLRRCVGFADLVAFTSLVRRLSERELARVVQQFEAVCSDVITAHGGRVIKTVGDEVLFVAKVPADGARIALDLVAAIHADDMLPPVRLGLAYGPVVSRLGDVFGTTVNKAARLTAVAPRGRILVDDVLAQELVDAPGLVTVKQRSRTLRGVGVVTPSLLSPGLGDSLLA
ncbi:adenylate/guanylate cyclase domain-containing protein [Arsenicicoccus piscis]|uniref:Adenylate cyclase n=1 Tax=Arsenicicoccus piscis TaxID=673954 RepID=A0ABQ6HQS7_9MICO|nr:adenylate/guanylate cyclase domain-containing protein [Arsenicicoccus piscis]MCH8629088.1 adenylate/guanylate cyclase domain-containing protein [Arsenicicoccus piscis]GMA20357.1 adenylate cyclase [Arsenicicoccus piscis]